MSFTKNSRFSIVPRSRASVTAHVIFLSFTGGFTSLISSIPRDAFSTNETHKQGAAPFTVLKYLAHCSSTACNGVHTLF